MTVHKSSHHPAAHHHVSKKQAQQQMVTEAESLLFRAGHDITQNGKLSKKEKKTLAIVKQARGLKANGKLDKKTMKSLKKMVNQIGKNDQFVAGQKTEGILQAEKSFAAQGLKHGKIDGILDKKTNATVKQQLAEQPWNTGDGFDPNGINQAWNGSFPTTAIAAGLDPMIAANNAAWAAMPQTGYTTNLPDPQLLGYRQQYEQFFSQPSAQPGVGNAPSDDTVAAGDVQSPFFRSL